MGRTSGRILMAALSSLAMAMAMAMAIANVASGADAPPADAIHVKAFDLPPSSLLSQESRKVLQRVAKEREELNKKCSIKELTTQVMVALRECHAKHHYPPLLARVKARYPANIERQVIGGVQTEIITPADGISAANQRRVLINLHGGGFILGGRWGGQVESIPLASVGKVKVVSVDYRMAPEHRFPAASEDVEAVYRELLETYQPQNIGIYGCSAGGMLAAQAVAWLQRAKLPPPGAVGMFCAAGAFWGEGDSGHISAAASGWPAEKVVTAQENDYFKDVANNDALAFPVRAPQVLAQFPPSLLIASTRDLALSSVAHTHSRLVALGVPAELHVWEGLDHAFFMEPDLPESQEAHDVAIKFFDRHLGKPATAARKAGPSNDEVMVGQIEQFVQADRAALPPPCQVLFVGSSSIVKWETLAADMAPLPVINRGFGGSEIEHVNRWFDQVVAPYRPRAIVFYAGENDIAAGKSVEQVVADFDSFMERKSKALGQTPVYFVSLKPSKLRYWQLESQSEVNAAIRARAARRADLDYIDIVPAMLENGKPKDLFVADNLHLAPQGYAVWAKAVKAALAPEAQAQEQRCRRVN